MQTIPRKNPSRFESTQASSLVVVSVLVLIASTLVATAMLRSQQAGRLANFSEVNADLRSAAEGELERCFFLWKTMMAQKAVDPSFVAPSVRGTPVPLLAEFDDMKFFLEAPPTSGAINGVVDTVGYNAGFAGMTFGNPATGKYQFSAISEDKKGLLAGATSATSTRGRVSTYRMIVWVTKTSMGGPKTVVVGRTFTSAKSATFQNAIFYSGNMELTPGGDMTVEGDIACNSDIYLGGKRNLSNAALDGSMTVKGTVKGTGALNQDTNFQEDIGFNVAGDTTNYISPTFPSGRDIQAARTTQSQNFLGGLDVATVQGANPLLFPTPNDVYHAIIDPPPSSGADPMFEQRMYNKAGLRMEVKDTGSGPYVKVTDSAGNDYTTQFAPMFPSTSIRKIITDQREKADTRNTSPSSYEIPVTTIDVGALNAKIDSIPALKSSFNGVLYAYDSVSAKAGIRLSNGAETPNFNNKGFTFATRSGLYIEGDYNTTLGADGKTNRTVVMADAVTGLSNSWDDANSADPNKFARQASDTTYNTAVITGDVAQDVTTTTDADGNITSTQINFSSGGPHNLVRFLESWFNQTFTLKGSLVQLFQSKTFNSRWVDQKKVYYMPSTRNINFDTELAENPMDNFVELSVAKRGDYFVPSPSEIAALP